MPLKLNYSGEAKINSYFEKNIKDTNDSNRFIASFRGRKFNGKNIPLANSDFSNKEISQYEISALKSEIKFDANSILNIKKIDEINKIYHWKFDEEFKSNNEINNINKFIKDLNKFK